MFDATFFKFLIAFILIIGISLIVASYVGGLNQNSASSFQSTQSSQ